MLILYTKTGCPFCGKVLAFVKGHNIQIDERDYLTDEKYLQEILERGGKRQVPLLIDEEKNVSLYESDDIITYLQEHYVQ